MEKIIHTGLLSFAAVVLIAGCSGSPDKQAAKTYSHPTAEVYKEACAICHGDKGEGVPEKKGPSLNDKSLAELKTDIFDLKNGGFDGHSAGTKHEVMEHNMKKLVEKGYDYDIDAMAKYIFETFNINK